MTNSTSTNRWGDVRVDRFLTGHWSVCRDQSLNLRLYWKFVWLFVFSLCFQWNASRSFNTTDCVVKDERKKNPDCTLITIFDFGVCYFINLWYFVFSSYTFWTGRHIWKASFVMLCFCMKFISRLFDHVGHVGSSETRVMMITVMSEVTEAIRPSAVSTTFFFFLLVSFICHTPEWTVNRITVNPDTNIQFFRFIYEFK